MRRSAEDAEHVRAEGLQPTIRSSRKKVVSQGTDADAYHNTPLRGALTGPGQ